MVENSREALVELAERVEKAEGADRNLDAEIGRYFAADFLRYIPHEPQHGCAPFTKSLDAAMSLVPEGWQFGVGRETDSHWATIAPPNSDQFDMRATESTRAKSPALALTAAALRARSVDLA